jgi:hypothetical protein
VVVDPTHRFASNAVGSLDVQFDQPGDQRTVMVRSTPGEFTHECRADGVARSVAADGFVPHLQQLSSGRGAVEPVYRQWTHLGAHGIDDWHRLD